LIHLPTNKTMHRTAREVAAQAIIYGTLGFRASLEVTEHRRTTELCSRLLPWLEQFGLGNQIEEFHREILKTAHGGLPHESQTEAYWRGESAALLGWAIQLFDQPKLAEFIDPGLLLENLRILRPEASEILSSATLRSKAEIVEYCAYCLTVRHELERSGRSADLQAALSWVQQKRLAKRGLGGLDLRLKGDDVEASTLASATPGVKALSVVRALAAEWLLGVDH
jgi:hypothetical protein